MFWWIVEWMEAFWQDLPKLTLVILLFQWGNLKFDFYQFWPIFSLRVNKNFALINKLLHYLKRLMYVFRKEKFKYEWWFLINANRKSAKLLFFPKGLNWQKITWKGFFLNNFELFPFFRFTDAMAKSRTSKSKIRVISMTSTGAKNLPHSQNWSSTTWKTGDNSERKTVRPSSLNIL